MATLRENLKCEVCGTKTLVRTQIGWLDRYQIRFICGNCEIFITGNMYLDQLNGKAYTEFSNAQKVNDVSNSDFHIEVSGELLTGKLQPFIHENTLLPPFFTSALGTMGDDFGNFKNRTLYFLSILKNDWPKVRRVNELWLNGTYQYLGIELKKQIYNKKFPLKNELQYLTAVRQTNIRLLSNVLSDDFFKIHMKFITDEFLSLYRNSSKEFSELLNFFSLSLHRNEEKLFESIKEFIKKFESLIPVFGMDFYEKDSILNSNNKGITTVSFEELKQFYVDLYEVITANLDLIVAFNNLKYRGDFKLMKEKRRDITTIDAFSKKAKGAKAEFIDGTEKFDSLVYPHLNNQLRNAIGHNSYKVDMLNQHITYFPKGNEDSEESPVISLKDFARNCWDLFQSLMNLSELIYQMRKFLFLEKGLEPAMTSIF